MFKHAKASLRQWLCTRLRVPYTESGIPLPLLNALNPSHPITLIDVGAHEGAFTRSIARSFKISKALLIEPLPAQAQVLLRDFPQPEFTILNCALATQEGKFDFEVNENAYTSSLLTIKRDLPELANVQLGNRHLISVAVRPMDSVVSQMGIEDIDLLKIDVQGAELQVLNGASETLNRVGLVWIEISFKLLYNGACSFEQVHSHLSDSGFILIDLDPEFRSPNGELLQCNALFKKI